MVSEEAGETGGESLSMQSSDGELPIPGEDDIPSAPLWAMRPACTPVGASSRGRRVASDAGGRGDDDAVYVIDDGPDHCMVGRSGGPRAGRCVYCLVARISLEQYADIEAGELD